MKYPRVWLDAYNEYNLEMVPPENYGNLVRKINNSFIINFENLSKKILKEFGLKSKPQFNWDERRGLHLLSISPGISCGIYFADFEKGLVFKNVASANKCFALLNIISTYYDTLQKLD